MATKVILDVDTGSDDAVAIMAAASVPGYRAGGDLHHLGQPGH